MGYTAIRCIDVGKDLWYFSGPVVYISFGYLVFERLGSWQRLVQPLVDHRRIFLSCHNRWGCSKPGTITRNCHSRRLSAASQALGTFVLALPAVLLVLMRHVGLPTIGVTRLTMVRATTYILSTIAVLSLFSRTHMVCLAAGLVCTVNPRFTPRRVRNYTVVLLGGAVLLALASGMFHSDKVGVLLEFICSKRQQTRHQRSMFTATRHMKISI